MSNKQNDEIYESAVEYVEEMMAENPTIPPEAFTQLVNEEIEKRMSVEPDWQPDTYEEAYGYNLETGEY